MKGHTRKLEELEKGLLSAYRAQEDPKPGVLWRESVMGELRRLGPLEVEGDEEVLFGRLAWRFSAAAVFVALILLVYMLSNGFVDYQDLAMRYLENPMDFII